MHLVAAVSCWVSLVRFFLAMSCCFCSLFSSSSAPSSFLSWAFLPASLFNLKAFSSNDSLFLVSFLRSAMANLILLSLSPRLSVHSFFLLSLQLTLLLFRLFLASSFVSEFLFVLEAARFLLFHASASFSTSSLSLLAFSSAAFASSSLLFLSFAALLLSVDVSFGMFVFCVLT